MSEELIPKEHILVKLGRERLEEQKANSFEFVKGNDEANALINDLSHFPHAFVLSCLMDRQTKAEVAWTIPIRIKNIIGSFDMKTLSEKTDDEYKEIFSREKLHRFSDMMASVFYKAVQRIHNCYNDDASNIWKNEPSSATVVYRFLEFEGAGIKISTMAANLLARLFKIEFSDKYSIDVSPDVHVKRVMKRMGLIDITDDESSNKEINKVIYKARELNPEFPGIIDFSVWEIGRNWCKAKKPYCKKCEVCDMCPKVGV